MLSVSSVITPPILTLFVPDSSRFILVLPPPRPIPGQHSLNILSVQIQSAPSSPENSCLTPLNPSRFSLTPISILRTRRTATRRPAETRRTAGRAAERRAVATATGSGRRTGSTGRSAGRPRLADQPARRTRRLVLELAGKSIGGVDENPAAGPASRATPHQRTVAAVATGSAERLKP